MLQGFYQKAFYLGTDCSINTAHRTPLLTSKSKCREKNKTRELSLTLNPLSMPGLHEFLFKNWVPADTSIWPSIQLLGMFSFLFTRFLSSSLSSSASLVHILLQFTLDSSYVKCFYHSLPWAVIWLCNPVPGHRVPGEHKLSRRNGISLMSLHWEWPRHPLKPPRSTRILHFQVSYLQPIHKDMRQLWILGIFFLSTPHLFKPDICFSPIDKCWNN